MTKVEELKEDTITMVRLYDHGEMIMPDVVRSLDSLISAACSEGVAEGAEQKRLEILKEALGDEGEEFVSVPVSLLRPIPTTKEEYDKMCKDAVLAPTKAQP